MMLVLSFMQYCYHRFMFSESKAYPKEVSLHLFHVHYYKRTRQIDVMKSAALCHYKKSKCLHFRNSKISFPYYMQFAISSFCNKVYEITLKIRIFH